MAEYENTINTTVITGSDEADSITNIGTTVTINALAGDDTIDNSGATVTIDAGKGNDSIINSGSSVSIYGGAGDDTMVVNGETVTVSKGDDTIDNSGNNVTIDGGVGDDSIANTGSNVSISGGTGNNVINIDDGTGVTVNVSNGDDIIYMGDEITSLTVKDFGENDEIQFNGAIENFTSISGGVKADNVTIAGLTVATSAQQWSGTTKYIEKITEGATLSSNENSIVYTPASETTLFTISGITSTSNITVDAENKFVTVGAAALTTANVSISSDYTLVLDDDVEPPTTTSGWTVSGTTYAYKDISTVAGYTLEDNQIIYTPATDGTTFVQLSGLKSEPTLDGNSIVLSAENFSTNVTVNSNANNYAFFINEGNYSKKTFTGTANADTIYNDGSTISIAGGAGDDSIFNSGTTVYILGGSGADTINNNGSKVTILGGDDDDYIINFGDNISINGGAGADSIDLNSGSNVTINVASGNDTINLGNVTSLNVQNFSEGDAIDLGSFIDSLGTVTGGITAGNITVKGISSLSTTTNQWSLKSGAATYYQKITAGATLAEDNYSIIYAGASTSNLFTITGVTSTVGINIDDTTVTLSESALGTSNISISSDDYSLALGDDVSNSTVADTWIKSGTTYAYKTNSTIAGYDLDRINNVINYTAAKDGTTVVELTNLNIDDDEPTVSATSIELSADIFSGNVSVKSNSGNYEFKLDEGNYSKKTFSGSANADSIYNDGTAISINGGAGDDSINNESNASNVSISGGAGADTIENFANNVTINGDAGNDYIYNRGDNVSINGGAGADSIFSGGNSATILGSTDNDYIVNDGGQNILFQFSGGNDTIGGFSSTDTLQILSGSITSAYSDGYDAFLTVGKNTIMIEDLITTTNKLNIINSKGSVSSYTISLVKGTSGDDYLRNDNDNVTIDALAGNDDIDNFGNSVTISGGADNDTVDSYGNNVSINGGTGDNLINIGSGSSLIINVSEGNNTISLGNNDTSIKVEDFSSSDVILFANAIDELETIEGGIVADNITISGLSVASVSSAWSLDGSEANFVETYTAGVALSKDRTSIIYRAEGEQNTLFTVSGVKDTSGLALEDSVIVAGAAALDEKNVSVNNDYSLALGSDVSNPEFINDGWSESNNNYVYKSASTVAGYQTVSSSEIYYFKAAGGSTLVELSGVGSEPNINGSSIVLSAENFSSNVAVVSNANKYSFELSSDDFSGKIFTATSSADTITNYGSTIEIQSGKGNDLIDNSGDNVTINAGAGNDSIYNRGDNISLLSGTGNDSIDNHGNYATISTGAGNNTVTNDAINIIVRHSSGNDIIEGFDSTDTLQISSASITSAYSDGTDIFLTVGENTITFKNLTENKINLMAADDTVSSEYFIPILKGTQEADYITNDYSNLTIQALGGDDVVNNSGSSVTVDAGADNDLISNSYEATKSLLLGQAGNDTISNDADYVIISGGVGDDSIANIGSNVSINGGEDNDNIKLDNSSDVTVNVESGNDTIVVGSNVSSFTVQKFAQGDRINLQVLASELTSTKGGIKIDDDLTITGLTASNVTNKWSLDSGVATYYQNYTAGVTFTDNNSAIVYTEAGTKDIFSISGVTSTDGIIVDGNTVTVSASALGESNVSISGDYYLELGQDVTPPTTTSGWSVSGNTYAYKDISTIAGYELNSDNTQIIYTPATNGTTFVQLSGLNSEPAIGLNSILLSAENFSTNVTVNSNANGYDFELSESDYSGKSFIGTSGNDFINNNYGSNVIINSGAGADTIDNSGPSSTITTGRGNDSVYTRSYGENVKVSTGAGSDTIENEAIYASINSGAGADSISNSGASSTLYGGADNDYIYNSGENVTINSGAGDDTIELNLLSDVENYIEYNSGDGNDVVTMSSSNSGARIFVDLLSGTVGGYSTTEENDFILQVDDGSLTFKNADGERINIRTPEGESYIRNGVWNTTISVDDNINIIDNKGSYVTVQSGKGNDTVTLNADDESSTDNVYEYSKGKGKDVVYNYGNTDKIKITDNSKVKVKIKDDDLNLRVGTSSMTLKDAAKNQTAITVVNAENETLLSGTYTTAGKINENATAIELVENFSGTYTAEDDMSTVDGSNVVNKIWLIGNEDDSNSLIGGRSNDTLEGATLDDNLTGGKGSDVFVYKGGLDVITDYEKRDRIKLDNDSPTVTSYTISDKNLTLGLSSDSGNDSLTIENGADKVITFMEGRKKTRSIYTTTGIFDGKEKTVSLSGGESLFSAARNSKLVTIDGSGANDYLNIIGNSKKNYIIGSTGGTMTGGKGKDTLIASGGSDVFIYAKGDGKDIIDGYSADDVVSLGSGVTIKDAKIKSGNSVIKVASGSITINDTKTATLISDGNEITFNNGAFIDGTNSLVKVYGSYKDDIELGDFEVVSADASGARRKLTITGTDSANSITGGKGKDSLIGGDGDDSLVGGKGNDNLWGGAGNDTLVGGKGNDILYGDAGNDTFIFTAGDGVDTIAGYESGELLSIINKRGREVDVGKTVFDENKGTLSLLVKNGGGKLVLTGVTSSTSVNINGTSKRISAL